MFGGKKIWVTWCLHDVCWLHSFLFFYLRSKSLHRFLCFYLLKINLAHINYIILRRDLFDYSQECQNCHKTTTIAHITASTPKTFFFSSLKMREYHSVKLISSVENSSCEGENLWSGRTSSFTLPEHLSTKNLTKTNILMILDRSWMSELHFGRKWWIIRGIKDTLITPSFIHVLGLFR